jgi:alcohol dehydrogenase class IV
MKDYTQETVRFVMRTEMLVGQSEAMKLAALLKERGWSKPALVVDRSVLERNAYAKRVVDEVKKELSEAIVVLSEMPEPTYEYLDLAKSRIDGKPVDCLVGIGGGSTMDLSKGLASLATNPGPGITYRGFNKLVNPPLPVVALPTTAGSGSDVTPYAVFIDTAQRWKFGINSEFNYPRLAIYDSGFLESCPREVYASSGMDAMTHTLESFVAKNATRISRGFSMKAFELLFPSLSKIAAGDRSVATRLDVLVGSGIAGVALMNSGAGPSGALSYPLGVHFNVPHGLAGSVFLPEVIRFNVEKGYTDYVMLYDLIPGSDPKGSAAEKSLRFAQEIEQLSARLGIPTTLAGFGVHTEEHLKSIIDNAWQLKAAFEQNPIPFGPAEIEQTVRALGTK